MKISVSLLPHLEEKDNSSFDAFLYVGETLIIKAHRSILSLAIPFFERTFQSGMKEAETGEVKFPEKKVSAEVLKALVRCIYGEKLNVDSANVHEIHDAANFLEMDEISVKCAAFMASNLGVDTVIATWEYAHRDFAGSNNLLKQCEELVENRFLDVYAREDFLKQGVNAISQFLSSKQIKVSSENDVVDALLRWLNHDWENRFHLVSERSLLDLVFWESVDSSVGKFMSLKLLRDRDCDQAAEQKAFTMISKRVMGLPEVASEPLCRAKAESLVSDSAEVGSVYVVQTGQNNTRPLVIYDVAKEHFRGPLTLNLPEGFNTILGMTLHQSHPFMIVSTGITYTNGQQLLLLELRNGGVKSKIDLILPPDVPNGHAYEMAAVPPNSDKVCIGLREVSSGVFKLLLVYDLSMQHLEPPKGEGSRGSLRCSHSISDIPKTAIEERYAKLAYTPGRIWVFQTKVIRYGLKLKSWSTPFDLDASLGTGWTTSSVLVTFDYIVIANTKHKDCQIQMLKFRNGMKGSLVSFECSLADYNITNVSLATMGQLLLVCLDGVGNREYKTFSLKMEDDGKPSGQLSRDESMDQFKHDFMLQIM